MSREDIRVSGQPAGDAATRRGGCLRLRNGASVSSLAEDDRWLLDDPPSVSWFDHTLELGWTRDPFDRLLVAHAALRRWRLATGDGELVERLGPRTVPL